MQDDGTLEPGKFYADYPLWTLYDEALATKFGMPGGVPRINPPGMEPMLVVFTDQDLARRFVEALRRPDVRPLASQIRKLCLQLPSTLKNPESSMLASTFPSSLVLQVSNPTSSVTSLMTFDEVTSEVEGAKTPPCTSEGFACRIYKALSGDPINWSMSAVTERKPREKWTNWHLPLLMQIIAPRTPLPRCSNQWSSGGKLQAFASASAAVVPQPWPHVPLSFPRAKATQASAPKQ